MPRDPSFPSPRVSTRLGAVVLCGGQSTRMGRSKALLPFGNESMLARVVRIVSAVAAPVVVVGAPGQALPALPGGATIAHDDVLDHGPLAGLAAGLQALVGDADAAFVTGCDTPLLRPEFIAFLFELLADHDAVAPRIDGRWNPLAAVYQLRTLGGMQSRLAAGQLRLQDLLAALDVLPVTPELLRAADPELVSLHNVNSPDAYRAALLAAGYGGGGQ